NEGWNELDLAENFTELFEKRDKKEIGRLLVYNARHITPEYVKQGVENTVEGLSAIPERLMR
ncbi:MAG: hypothetical protein ABEJ72_08080, partial [Candidatus Aenigmatarchaeota archaeon]